MAAQLFALLVGMVLLTVNSFAAEKQDKRIEAVAKQSVKNMLKDPSSVQFRGLHTNSAGDVCGQFNAKNSYGGYEGFEDFMYEKSSQLLLNVEKLKIMRDIKEIENLVHSMEIPSDELFNRIQSTMGRNHRLVNRISACEAW